MSKIPIKLKSNQVLNQDPINDLTIEIWKELSPEFPLYAISNRGRLRTMKNNYISQLRPNVSGYIRPSLKTLDGTYKNIQMHQLVARAFFPNPNGKSCINHKNGIRSDNQIETLEWATVKENNNSKVFKSRPNRVRKVIQCDLEGSEIRTWDSIKEAADAISINRRNISTVCSNTSLTCGGYKWKYYEENRDSEEWREISVNEQIVQVSSHGRVKIDTDLATYGSQTETYRIMNVNKKSFRVHRVVCMAFKPIYKPDDYVVNHIDGNKCNNHMDNLEWVTHKENRIHAQQLERRMPNRCRSIQQMDLSGNVIATYGSLTEAAKTNGMSKGTLSLTCSGKRETASGYKWAYIN